MPSNSKRIFGVLATAALFVGGAWVASGLRTDIAVTSASSTGTPSDYGLVINLRGARSDKGQLVVMAFDNAAAFDILDYNAAAGFIALPASMEPQRVDFPDLNADYYSVVAYHDENGDYEMGFDENWMPTEGHAVSGMNDLYDDPVFEYSLISPGMPVDLVFFYWPAQS
ncbi:DUF2141 domain-containing protein [Ruegeria sp. HKCCD7559]|uniref:DUF2141 domain-containing protein n=1 Tax=Ruegeria sp. HKCCD7559 TaxID=2683005 RepID=UPI00149213ED|nr:DUF2141 domain-containing protein [Ruegeria sp. HKCCD7559]NOC45555.1 DUF2141 domain-containing protein [Ruegeria sp. HKCCD7559]